MVVERVRPDECVELVARNILIVQGNLAVTYRKLGRNEETLRLKLDVYSGRSKLHGEEHLETIRAAHNYANSLLDLRRFEEAKSLVRRTIPVARRVLGEEHSLTLRMSLIYGWALYKDPVATRDDLREAVETLESVAKSCQQLFGVAHPDTSNVLNALANARKKLAAAAPAASASKPPP